MNQNANKMSSLYTRTYLLTDEMPDDFAAEFAVV